MIKWNYIQNWSIQIQESTFENVVKMRKIKQTTKQLHLRIAGIFVQQQQKFKPKFEDF